MNLFNNKIILNNNMGNTHAKKGTKVQTEQATQLRNDIVQQRKQQIEDLQQQYTNQNINLIKNSNMEESNIIIKNMNSTTAIVEKSKQQLDRGGEKFTKSDLIAIIIALEPSYSTKIDVIELYTVNDLNAIIRVIIYDPLRYVNSITSNINTNISSTLTTNQNLTITDQTSNNQIIIANKPLKKTFSIFKF